MAAVTMTLPSLRRISRESLSTLLLASPNDETVVVVDVRDSDHVGGHIKSSRHVPSSTLDHAAPELVKQLQHAPRVVFHCALSQQRGPSAALKYLRERERLFPGMTVNLSPPFTEEEGKPGDKVDAKTADGTTAKPKMPKQEVFVLDGGFVRWQEKYGNDERLTENYNAELWAEGY